jgi:hypothetical protein
MNFEPTMILMALAFAMIALSVVYPKPARRR